MSTGAAMIVYLLTRPTSYMSEGGGEFEFPRMRELRGPITWHRNAVLQDALGMCAYDEPAGLAALKGVTDEQRDTIAGQCAFIREHARDTIWQIPDDPLPDPFDPDEWIKP